MNFGPATPEIAKLDCVLTGQNYAIGRQFLPRDAMLARYMSSSVCLSVTLRYENAP